MKNIRSVLLGLLFLTTLQVVQASAVEPDVIARECDQRWIRGHALLSSLAPDFLSTAEAELGFAGRELLRHTVSFAYGDVLSRPYLSPPIRQMIIVAMLTGLADAQTQLAFHINVALDVGVTPAQIQETILLASVYSGFPAAINASAVAAQVFHKQGINTTQSTFAHPDPDRRKRALDTLDRTSGDAGRSAIKQVRRGFPDLAELLTDYVYGDVISRTVLTDLDSELIQVAAAAAGRSMLPQLAVHVRAARNVGAVEAELYEIVLLASVYAGFPAAINSATVINQVLSQTAEVPGRHRVFQVPAPSLADAALFARPQQPIYVYLPPTYESSSERYPVVYYLHGFGESAQEVLQAHTFLDQFFHDNDAQEFIVVAVNGANFLGGSFWTNSPASGRWRDFLVQDVVSFVDQTLRTRAEPGYRGIGGFSMGASAALFTAWEYPDVFQAVSVVAPGLFAPGGLSQALQDWDQVFKLAYGAAFAPDLESPPALTRIPDPANIALTETPWLKSWESGFGGLEQKLVAYARRPSQLKSIRIAVGQQDRYRWIIEGCRHLAKLLTQRGIVHDYVEFTGTHEVPGEQVRVGFLQFFSTAFSASQSPR